MLQLILNLNFFRLVAGDLVGGGEIKVYLHGGQLLEEALHIGGNFRDNLVKLTEVGAEFCLRIDDLDLVVKGNVAILLNEHFHFF